jgi:hypothetical protein
VRDGSTVRLTEANRAGDDAVERLIDGLVRVGVHEELAQGEVLKEIPGNI